MIQLHPALWTILFMSVLALNLAALAEARQAVDVKRKCTCRRWAVMEAICVAAAWGTWLSAPALSGGLAVAILGTSIGIYALMVIRAIHKRGGHDDDHGSGKHIRMRMFRKPATASSS
jgi:hypothetical protein